jgi:hypothetical protein
MEQRLAGIGVDDPLYLDGLLARGLYLHGLRGVELPGRLAADDDLDSLTRLNLH